MPKAGKQVILFLALMVFVICFPMQIDALRIATTLYEDLKKSALVGTGRIVHEQTDDGLTYFDLALGNIIYGRSSSATVSIVTVGETVKRKHGLTMSVSTGRVGYAIGEEVVVFLKKASPGNVGRTKLKGDLNYITVQKIDLGGLEDREGYLAELDRLAETVDLTDIERRESIFLDLLSSRNDPVVESAVKELGSMKSRQALTALSQLVHSGSGNVRFQVIDAMRQIGGKEAVSVIASALGDESPRIRSRAAGSLGWMGAKEAEDKLIGMFLAEDEDENVKVNVVLALGNMGSTKAVPILMDALNDETISRTLRGSIENALRKLQ